MSSFFVRPVCLLPLVALLSVTGRAISVSVARFWSSWKREETPNIALGKAYTMERDMGSLRMCIRLCDHLSTCKALAYNEKGGACSLYDRVAALPPWRDTFAIGCFEAVADKPAERDACLQQASMNVSLEQNVELQLQSKLWRLITGEPSDGSAFGSQKYRSMKQEAQNDDQEALYFEQDKEVLADMLSGFQPNPLLRGQVLSQSISSTSLGGIKEPFCGYESREGSIDQCLSPKVLSRVEKFATESERHVFVFARFNVPSKEAVRRTREAGWIVHFFGSYRPLFSLGNEVISRLTDIPKSRVWTAPSVAQTIQQILYEIHTTGEQASSGRSIADKEGGRLKSSRLQHWLRQS